MIQRMLSIWSLVCLPFLNPACTSGISQFTDCWNFIWRFEHYLASIQNKWNCAVVWVFFGIVFLWDWNESWPFPVLWPRLSFPNFYDQPRQHVKKQRHHFANRGPSSQGYGFSSSHVWIWELDYKERWVPKNWCFWTVVLEKTLESPLDSKEIQPVHPKGNQSWIFVGRTDADAKS